MDLAHKYDVHAVILHETRNDIFIDKLEVECPGNRFEECTGWETFIFHVMLVELSKYCVMIFWPE